MTNNADSSAPHRRALVWRLTCFGSTALLGGGCDLGTKAWSVDALSGLPGQALMLAEPWLELALAYNRGTAFGVMTDLGATRLVFGVLSLLVLLWFTLLIVRTRCSLAEIISLGAIAGGAIGNGLDRLFRQAPGGGTGVVDFIKVNYPWGGSWPTFNVADALIACGALGFWLARAWQKRRLPKVETA